MDFGSHFIISFVLGNYPSMNFQLKTLSILDVIL